MRTLPHNTEAEQAVLGIMILSKNATDEALSALSISDFYVREHQIIFAGIKYLVDNLTPVDITTLTAHLVEKNQLDDIGGVEYLTSISQSVISSANVDYYINIILEKSLLRNLIDTSEKIASKGYEGLESTNDLIQDAEKDILKITRNRRTSDFKDSKEILKEVHENLVELSKNKEGLTGIPTGFTKIDQLTNGLQKGDLIILAARPSVGKTAFALNLAQNAAHISNKPVAIFSLEMGADQLIKRMISATGRIEGSKLRNGQLSDEDWLKYSKASSTLSKDPIYIDDTPAIKVMEIASKCRKLEREQGLGLIVIDYLQLITGSDNSRESRQVEVSEISRALKGLARELNVPVVALSQLSRSVEQRTDKRPMMSDLRESGAIEQDADIVAFLYRDDYYNKEDSEHPNQVDVIFGKHRNGATDTITLTFEKDVNKFLNIEYRDFE
ncbi:replicative DNA helicase [Bacilli bacterium PM5-3]|nr:replicative DNA helicase [Bacilli bacterium PM5-3]MDH6603380.1 replicative DNA helicase [Bacilli bacterium PM5-9]